MKIPWILWRHLLFKIAQDQDETFSVGQYAERVGTFRLGAFKAEEIFKEGPCRSHIWHCDVYMVQFHWL